MPSIRIGFSTDFNLTGEQIGIGTTNPTARLDVAGQIRSDDSAGSGGVSTVTRYSGFLDEAQGLGNNVSIAETTKGNLNSLSGEIKISGEVTVTEDTKLTGGRLDSLTVTGKFDLPHSGSEDREDTPEKGSTRFNQDLGQLEFYTGTEWRTTLSYDGSGRGRGVFGGGTTGSDSSIIDFITISTLGNAQSFGDLTQARRAVSAVSSNIRGLFAGGISTPVHVNTIDYVTIASQGNAINFGDFSSTSNLRQDVMACSSSTRGLFAGGYTPTPANAALDVIDYVEIATLGDAIDFGGDLTVSRKNNAAAASPVRAVFAGGRGGTSPAPTGESKIDTVLFSSKGTNATDFGDLTGKRLGVTGCSSSVRGIFVGGYVPGIFAGLDSIDFITIASLGNAQDFGNLSTGARHKFGTSTQIRGVFAGGYSTPGQINNIEYVTIMTAGNAQDFGDLSVARRQGAGLSDSHGGLGGF